MCGCYYWHHRSGISATWDLTDIQLSNRDQLTCCPPVTLLYVIHAGLDQPNLIRNRLDWAGLERIGLDWQDWSRHDWNLTLDGLGWLLVGMSWQVLGNV